MRKFAFLIFAFLFVGGCAGKGGGTDLSVVSVSPAADATDVAVTTNIAVTFNRSVDAAKLTDQSFIVKRADGIAVPGTVSYDDATKTATFTPKVPFQNKVAYVATLTEESGIGCSWDFTTVSRPILFMSDRDLNNTDEAIPNYVQNIWAMNEDGSNVGALTRITAQSGNCTNPQRSPDGSKILFVSTRALDGSDAIENRTDPPASKYNIWVMNSDGSEQKPLTTFKDAALNISDVKWSSDGSKVIYVSNRNLDGTDSVSPNQNHNMWIMNADGSDAKPLTKYQSARANPYCPTCRPVGMGVGGGLQFSPDGSKIAYISMAALDGTDALNTNLASNIWLMNTDGSTPKPLTQYTINNLYTSGPKWSPDGTKILFLTNHDVEGADAIMSGESGENVWVIGADGSSPTALTKWRGFPPTSVTWSPDGSKIFYSSNRALDGTDAINEYYSRNIWVMNADGSNARPLTVLKGEYLGIYSFELSPDGSKIVYQSEQALDNSSATTGRTNVWLLKADGTDVPITKLANAGSSSARW